MSDFKVDLMLDSGAFSAWNVGDTISLNDYIAFVKEYEDWLWSYVVLDVLPTGAESKRTEAAIEAGAKQSYKNLQTMKDAGLKPIPVFHQGEKWRWLDKMLEDGETYIGFSTRKDIWAAEQRRWLDQCFTAVTDNAGRPLVKTHGFGIMTGQLMLRFPWYTVDSTTWSLSPGYGKLVIPRQGLDGEPDFSQAPIVINITDREHGNSSAMKNCFDHPSYGPMYQEFVTRYLNDFVGISIEEARYKGDERRRVALTYFENFAKAMVGKDRRFTNPSGFRMNKAGQEPAEVDRFLLFYATLSKNRYWGQLMNELGCRTRLLSFYEMRSNPDELVDFVENGFIKEGRTVNKRRNAKWKNTAYTNLRKFKLANRLKQEVEDAD